jgi:hypothetical protein
MAMQDAFPSPPPAGPTHPSRKRARWILSLVAVAVLGLVAGLLIWAPWHKVPVPPAVVHAQSPTATSVLVSWAPSKGGATIDRYLVLRDGAQVGSVPASQTSYVDNGLTPGTAHRYAIIAASGTQRSSPSGKAVVTTITPSPIGLTVGRETWTTVEFRWSPSPKAPVPDQYVIYSGATSIGAVPGSTDSYSVTGLNPGTTYQYQVVAKWGDHESGRSSALPAATLAVPLQGDVPVEVTTVSTPGQGASLSPGQKWSDSWTFSSDCTATRCTLKADAEFAAPGFVTRPFTMTLTGSGAGYAGTTMASVTMCMSVNVRDTVTLRISANKGGVDNGGWNSWSGTMMLSSPYTAASSTTYCPAQAWDFSVAGTHS